MMQSYLTSWFKTLCSGKPHYTIGDPDDLYMKRWWIIPRNNWFNIYLHKTLKSDDDRALHDHRGHNVSIILRTGFVECIHGKYVLRKPGNLIFRRAETPHRLILLQDENERPIPSWSLFIVGPAFRDWGFHCTNGWRSHNEFIKTYPGGNSRGRGCD